MGYSHSDSQNSIDMVASTQNAATLDQQYRDYKKIFQPQEENYLNEMGGKGLSSTLLPSMLEKAKGFTETINKSTGAQQARDQERLGQGFSPMQQQAMDSAKSLTNSANLDNTHNQTTMFDQDMKNEALSGGLGAASNASRQLK